ncbi:DUF362 domain-containing protein [bacterium]|nr:DUF362 domain-containing protein [bacterium]
MKRREFIRRSAATGSFIVGTQVTDMIYSGKTEAAVLSGGDRPLVAIAGSDDPALKRPAPLDELVDTGQVRDVVFLALDRDTSPRNLPAIVKKDSWVVIKTNIVAYTDCGLWADDYMHWGLDTDIRVIKAVIEYLVERIGPRRISIVEGAPWYTSGGKLKKEEFVDAWHFVWEGMGNLTYAGIVDEINARQSGTKVDYIDINEDDAVYVTDFDPYGTHIGAFQYVVPGDPDGTSKTEWTKRKGIYLPKCIMDSDVVISVPVLKTHSSAGVTLALKNFVGCVHSQQYGHGNSKKAIHQGSQLGLVRGIADLACAIKPDYAVAEGFWATIQQHEGQNGVMTNHNVVVAGGDVIATEAVCMLVMGYNPLDSDLLRLANMKKMGEWNPDRIEIAGPPVKRLSRNFDRAANTYAARGIRKWIMLGPLKSPIKDIPALKPQAGDKTEDISWELLDGDAIIDSLPNVSRPYRLQECLLYGLPGSKNAHKGSLFYLALRITTPRKDHCGQLLVGIEGGDFRAFLNGHAISYQKEALSYDPTPTSFLKFDKGENTLILEVKKLEGKKEDVRIAVNICDLDGDRLQGITLDPKGE